MIYQCPECGKIFNRDMRLNIAKYMLTTEGKYKSYCQQTGKQTECKPFLKKPTTYQGEYDSYK